MTEMIWTRHWPLPMTSGISMEAGRPPQSQISETAWETFKLRSAPERKSLQLHNFDVIQRPVRKRDFLNFVFSDQYHVEPNYREASFKFWDMLSRWRWYDDEMPIIGVEIEEARLFALITGARLLYEEEFEWLVRQSSTSGFVPGFLDGALSAQVPRLPECTLFDEQLHYLSATWNPDLELNGITGLINGPAVICEGSELDSNANWESSNRSEIMLYVQGVRKSVGPFAPIPHSAGRLVGFPRRGQYLDWDGTQFKTRGRTLNPCTFFCARDGGVLKNNAQASEYIG